MEYCNDCAFPNSPNAYSVLLKEIIRGNKMFFIRSDEVAEQWKIVDSIPLKKLPLNIYNKGTIPKSAHDLIRKDGREWHLFVEK